MQAVGSSINACTIAAACCSCSLLQLACSLQLAATAHSSHSFRTRSASSSQQHGHNPGHTLCYLKKSGSRHFGPRQAQQTLAAPSASLGMWLACDGRAWFFPQVVQPGSHLYQFVSRLAQPHDVQLATLPSSRSSHSHAIPSQPTVASGLIRTPQPRVQPRHGFLPAGGCHGSTTAAGGLSVL